MVKEILREIGHEADKIKDEYINEDTQRAK